MMLFPSWHAHQSLPVAGECNHRGCGPRTFRILNNLQKKILMYIFSVNTKTLVVF
jgi:hypothetical protein